MEDEEKIYHHQDTKKIKSIEPQRHREELFVTVQHESDDVMHRPLKRPLPKAAPGPWQLMGKEARPKGGQTTFPKAGTVSCRHNRVLGEGSGDIGANL